MSNYPSPCDTCTKKCITKGCQAWKTRYLYRQKQINGYAKKHGIEPTSPETILENPCDTCTKDDCREICKARAKYWDAGMEKVRKRVGM